MTDHRPPTAPPGEIGGKNPPDLRPIPRIAILAFCETPEVADVLERAAADRRMHKTHVKVHMGGIAAANRFFADAPTPNLLLVETRESRERALEQLDELAGVCDSGTKVIVIGHHNDVLLYRELIRRGASDYMVAPFGLFDIIREIGEIYLAADTPPVGRSIAFIGARGGTGSSTLAHNVAYSLSRLYEAGVLIADMDLAWGTAGLNFNQDPAQGIGDVVQSPDRVDEVFLDRLLAKCTDHLSLLAAPATLDRAYDFEEGMFTPLIDVARGGAPAVVLDLPHQWTGWVRSTLALADEVVITATPDLSSLRNTKNLLDHLKLLRPNDAAPRVVLNQVGLPKRPELKPADFQKALGAQPLAIIPFDAALFGQAANNGQMLADISPRAPIAVILDQIAQAAMGRARVSKARTSALAPFLARLPLGKKKSG